MIDVIITAFKGILPDSTWDLIFNQFKSHDVKFSQPSYSAVRVSKDYMLVKVPSQNHRISSPMGADGIPEDVYEEMLEVFKNFRNPRFKKSFDKQG